MPTESASACVVMERPAPLAVDAAHLEEVGEIGGEIDLRS